MASLTANLCRGISPYPLTMHPSPCGRSQPPLRHHRHVGWGYGHARESQLDIARPASRRFHLPPACSTTAGSSDTTGTTPVEGGGQDDQGEGGDPLRAAGSRDESTGHGASPKSQYEAPTWLQRTHLLIGDEGLRRLDRSRVLLVGLGGVGSFAAEFLVRAGIGHLTIVDGDVVDLSNKNRQLPALDSTVGRSKVEVVADRLLDINPDLDLTPINRFLDPGSVASLFSGGGESPSQAPSSAGDPYNCRSESDRGAAASSDKGASQERNPPVARVYPPVERDCKPYDYVIDCIDSIAPKLMLLRSAKEAGVPVISSMGAGGRLDPSRVRVGYLWDTHGDAFSALIRKRLRQADRKRVREGGSEEEGEGHRRDSDGGQGATTVGDDGGGVSTSAGGKDRSAAGRGSSGRRVDRRRETGSGSEIVAVWTDEPVVPASLALTDQRFKKSFYGTISYIPAVFGLYISSHVIRELLGTPRELLLSPPGTMWGEAPLPGGAAASVKKQQQPSPRRQQGQQERKNNKLRLRPSRSDWCNISSGPVEAQEISRISGTCVSLYLPGGLSERSMDVETAGRVALVSQRGSRGGEIGLLESSELAQAADGEGGSFIGLGI